MKQVCTTSKNTKNVCIFVKFLHGTMRDTLLPLLTTFQTGFRIRICNLIGCQEEGKLVQLYNYVYVTSINKQNTAFLGCLWPKQVYSSVMSDPSPFVLAAFFGNLSFLLTGLPTLLFCELSLSCKFDSN